ncbi:hypothetical protein [Microvirga rosea]|uniref:hypothetical protein n=1 Tax=Microvirga rosea TaxID=2715425 RepID=UPI001D09B5C4|nr:hypothetical protein [Microvirga rosea]MCB8821907.1 hypothetical protein [Microvirga rosea]
MQLRFHPRASLHEHAEARAYRCVDITKATGLTGWTIAAAMGCSRRVPMDRIR